MNQYCIEYIFANVLVFEYVNYLSLDKLYANIRVVINTSSKCKFGMLSPEQELSLKDENGDLIYLICNVAKALMQ